MYLKTAILLTFYFACIHLSAQKADTIFCTHKVVLDKEQKILPWYNPRELAYDHFLNLRWSFIKTRVPASPGPSPRSDYPQYYFYDGFFLKDNMIVPEIWMNDVGEKIPNWFENARLYYAYSGDSGVMNIVRDFIDYTLVHGLSASSFVWPGFPYTTTNPGDIDFHGFAQKFAPHETHLDHAAEMGLTYFRMYLFYGKEKYLKAALQVADLLAANVRTGTAEKSVWPYRVNMETGNITAEYGANWTGAYVLFDQLIKAGIGNIKSFQAARDKARDFMLNFPLKTGYWTDGHSDNPIISTTYKSNLSASNLTLALFDFPEMDPEWEKDIPGLIRWTEDNFIYRCASKGPTPPAGEVVDVRKFPGVATEPANMWGANIVGEQDGFIFKMDYQTARYAAACARWYAISGDESFREKAFRSLNWVTYCNDTTGMAFESPVSTHISSWWSDCYGECPRMFYQAFAGIPEFAPPAQNHILYSEGIINHVAYYPRKIEYNTTSNTGKEYLRLAFKPVRISLQGKKMALQHQSKMPGYTLKDLGNGDYAVIINRIGAGKVIIQ